MFPELGSAVYRRRWSVAKLVVTLALLSYVIYSSGPSTIVAALRGTDLTLFLLAVAVGVLGIAVSALRWQVLLDPKGLNGGFAEVLAIYYTGTFLNMSLPSTVGGDVLRAYAVTGDFVDSSTGFASIFVERLTGLVALLTFASVALLLHPSALGRPVGYGLGTGLGVALALTLVSFDSRFNRLVERVIGLVPSKPGTFAAKLYASIGEYREARGQVYKALALSFASQLVPIAYVLLLSRSIDLAIPILFLFVMVPLAQLVQFLPISFGGYGVREVVYAGFLAQIGVDASLAVALAILVGIQQLVKNSFGAVGLLTRKAI